MHEGFVNYHAGTLGTSMVEGRISAGVVVGKDSDIGGARRSWAPVRWGQGGRVDRRTLPARANSGVGISLGDDCVVEAGCYVTAGTKVTLPDGSRGEGRRALRLRPRPVRRNSVTGAIEAVPWKAGRIELNAALHAH